MSTSLVTLTIRPKVTAFTAGMHMAAYHFARYQHQAVEGRTPDTPDLVDQRDTAYTFRDRAAA